MKYVTQHRNKCFWAVLKINIGFNSVLLLNNREAWTDTSSTFLVPQLKRQGNAGTFRLQSYAHLHENKLPLHLNFDVQNLTSGVFGEKLQIWWFRMCFIFITAINNISKLWSTSTLEVVFNDIYGNIVRTWCWESQGCKFDPCKGYLHVPALQGVGTGCPFQLCDYMKYIIYITKH